MISNFSEFIASATEPLKPSENKYVSFGEKKPSQRHTMSKQGKNLADIEALLNYEGDDLDQLAMSNSKDALKIMDNIEDFIDSRLNKLLESNNEADLFGYSMFGLACN